MSWKSSNEEGNIGGKCKIRKRICNSSSSSSLAYNYRLKRAILVAKRGESTAPLPTWKMSTKLPSLLNDNKSVSKGKEASRMSSQKLASNLWGVGEVPSCNINDNVKKKGSKVDGVVRPSNLASAASHLSHNFFNQNVDKQKTRKSVVRLEKVDSSCYINIPGKPGIKTSMRDISEGLTTSIELLKVLDYMLELEKKSSIAKSLVAALKLEIDQTNANVGKLIKEQEVEQHDMDYLVKQFAEEQSAWKTKMKEAERIENAVKSIARELQVEKKLRGQSERLNKKLGKELAVTKGILLKLENSLTQESDV